MKRKLMKNLLEWLNSPNKRPLILRGARQTGKTYIVRQLAAEASKTLIEINFERDPQLGELFLSADPKAIISGLEIMLGKDIDISSSVLFLDEVQAYAKALGALRWFYEDMPTLPVIAAGSLLEFALDEYKDSMPVGRVTYMYLHPFTFTEFLWALGENKLAEYLYTARTQMQMPDAIHKKCLELYRQYCIVGGMPAAVREWVETKNTQRCLSVQKDLITSFRDDFNKYRKNVSPDVLRKAMDSVAYQLGGSFVYRAVDKETRHPVIKTAVEMLEKAGLCKRVYSTAANGVPLGAGKNERVFKNIFLDVGLYFCILGLALVNVSQLEEIIWSNKGAIAEQATGQLLYSLHSLDDDDLFYWQQSGSGTGEIDYLTQEGASPLPIEVKAGVSGSMKSLHGYMEKRGFKKAVRFDLNMPSVQEVSLKTTQGNRVCYTLISLPLYMAEYIF